MTQGPADYKKTSTRLIEDSNDPLDNIVEQFSQQYSQVTD